MKAKNIRHCLAVGLTMLALAANSTFAHDTVKGAGKLLELSRAATHRGVADSSVTHMSAASATTTTRADNLKGAAKLLELSGTRVVAGQNGQQNALLSSSPASKTKPTGIVKGAARLIELTRGSRSPQMQVAPLK